MSRWAVVVVDENGEVTVIGAYLWRWRANVVANAMRRVIAGQHVHDLGVHVEEAGWVELARAYGFTKRAVR